MDVQLVSLLTVLDSPGTVLNFVPSTNKVAGIVRLIILYHPVTGFGLVQRTYRLYNIVVEKALFSSFLSSYEG